MVDNSYRVRCTSGQIDLLVNYMAAKKDFANCRGEYAQVHKLDKEWEALRILLKEHGPDKTALQWKCTWRDLKSKARKAMRETDPQIPCLSETTLKILETIGKTFTVELDGEEITTEDWQVESEQSIPEENVIECNKNSLKSVSDKSLASDKSIDTGDDDDDDDDNKTVEEFTVCNKPLNNKKIEYKHLHRGRRRALVVGTQRRCPPCPPRPRSPPIPRRRRMAELHSDAMNDFLELERQRLRMEVVRDRRLHEREMKRIKLELERIEVQRDHNELLQHLVSVVQKSYELLQRKLN